MGDVLLAPKSEVLDDGVVVTMASTDASGPISAGRANKQ